jgi:type II secretory pathway component PulF
MTRFSYKTINTEGTVSAGKVEAYDRNEAASLVKIDGALLVELNEAKKSFLSFRKNENKFSSFERINFTDHLASLIRAGTPVKDALEAYVDEKSEGSVLITQIVNDIERGKPLSEAFAGYPDVFSPLYVSLVKTGEIAGNLDETLEYLANELRREHEFVQSIRSAMFYPSLILGVSVIVIAFIITVIVPKILQIAQNLGGEVPAITRLIINISDFISGNIGIIGLLALACIVALGLVLKRPEHRADMARKLLKFPIIGKIMKKYILARFMRIIASSVKYGISLTVAFRATGEVVGNIQYKESCERIGKRVEKGVSLSDAIAAEGNDNYPSIIVRSLRGAEKTGGIDNALNRLSIQFEREVDRDLKKLTELLEPVLVIIMGVIVLFIALSVVMPIYQLTSNLN